MTIHRLSFIYLGKVTFISLKMPPPVLPYVGFAFCIWSCWNKISPLTPPYPGCLWRLILNTFLSKDKSETFDSLIESTHWEQIQGTYIIYATTQTTDCLESYRSVQCEGRVQGVPKKNFPSEFTHIFGGISFFFNRSPARNPLFLTDKIYFRQASAHHGSFWSILSYGHLPVKSNFFRLKIKDFLQGTG